MFTGLIETTGKVAQVQPAGEEMDIVVDLAGLAREPAIGASIALSGVCCTVVEWKEGKATFRLSAETLRRTWLGRTQPGQTLNLEPAVRAGDPLGGHLVQGHVDGLAEVVEPIDPQAGGELGVRLPRELLHYCVEKGSITLDGISLTLASLEEDVVTIAVIPHTAQVTTLGHARAGDPMNVEVDVLAKYVERLLEPRL